MGCTTSKEAPDDADSKFSGFMDPTTAIRATGKQVEKGAANAVHHIRNVFVAPLEILEFSGASEHSKTKEETALIFSALKKNFVFESLDEKELTPLVKAFEKHPVEKDTVIIKQGDEGNYFYVILSGRCAFSIDKKEVGTAKAGDSFGELALLCKCRCSSFPLEESYIVSLLTQFFTDNCPRAATVTALEETVLFRVDQTTFRFVLQSQVKKETERKLELLKSVDFLKVLNERDMARLAHVLTPKRFKAGDMVFKRGDKADNFYIVADGTLKVFNITAGGQKYDDVEIGSGGYAGERAIVTGEPRVGDMQAVTDVLTFGIDKDTFERVLGRLDDLILKSMDKQKLVSDCGWLLLGILSIDHLSTVSFCSLVFAYSDTMMHRL
jgi:cAMP-dependent protein kinase regulator